MVSYIKHLYYTVRKKIAFIYYPIKNNELKVSPRASISYNSKFIGKIFIGENSTVLENAIFIGGEIEIGNNVIIAANCCIQTINHTIGSEIDSLPYGTGYKFKKVIIEDNVWIGRNVSIAPGAIIREGSVISMNSVVFGEIPPLSVAYGNPAVVKFKRDQNNYFLLKKNNLYLNDIRGIDYLTKSQKKIIILKIQSLMKVKDVVFDYELSYNPKEVRKIMYDYASLNNLIFKIDDNKKNFFLINER